MINTMKEKRARSKPDCVPDEIWRRWLAHWDDPEVIRKSALQRQNRYSEPSGEGTGCSKHTGGSKSFIEHELELAAKLGHPPDEFELFDYTHTNKDGQFIDGRSRLIAEEVNRRTVELIDSQLAEGSTETQSVNKTQVFLDVVGGSKKQRVYGLGSLASTFATSHSSTTGSSSSATDQQTMRRMEAEIADMRVQMAEMARRNAMMEEMMQQMLRMQTTPSTIQTPGQVRPRGSGEDNTAEENVDLGDD